MKQFIFLIVSAIILSGCGTRFVYVDPVYPKISQPRKVPHTNGAFVRDRCLWLDKKNTNLCDNDLKIVLRTIQDLRTNDATFRKNIVSYNVFVVDHKE